MAAAGVIARSEARLLFLPLHQVEEVLEVPRVSHLPGGRFDLALVGGQVVSVWRLGVGPDALLCSVGEERVLLSGLEVLAAGTFPGDEEVAHHDGQEVPRFDLVSAIEHHARGGGA